VGRNLCGFYAMENIRMIVSERCMNIRLHDAREELQPDDRLKEVQEELAGFLVKHVINPKGEFHYGT
jgi:hypothetical protein